LDGLTLIKSIRSRKDRTPVLILSARRSLNERIEGLEIGADDYLTKPFSFAELLARLKALLRRANPGLESSVLTVSNLTVDLSRRKAPRGENAIELQPLEFKLLVYLMRNGGQIVSKTMIMENVWEYDFNPETNVVESRISYLRDKIDKDYTPKLIHTIRGVGYVFEDRSQYT
jgi:two-component system OmpR family response regulator